MLYALVFQIWSAPADYEELATSSILSMSRAVKAETDKKHQCQFFLDIFLFFSM